MDQLIKQYCEAKRLEKEATEKRVELCSRIAAKLGAPDEGAKTHSVDNYKVTVKQPINRKVDWKVFDLALAKFPKESAPATVRRELDTKGLKWCRDNAPDFYLELSKAITVTPGRIQVDVKETED